MIFKIKLQYTVFDADPDQDPGSALEKMDPDPCHEYIFKNYRIFLNKAKLSNYFLYFFVFV